MPLTNAEALTLSRNEVFRHLIENAPERHQLAAIMPHYEIDGDRIAIPRVTPAGLGTADFILANGAVADTPATPTTPNVTFSLKLLATAYRTNKVPQRVMSTQIDQDATQAEAGAKRLLYRWSSAVFQGNETLLPQEFNGTQVLTTPAQTVIANGGAGGQPTLAEFDQMYSRIRVDNGVPMYFLGNRHGYEAWKRAHYALNSVPNVFAWEELPAPDGGTRRVACFYHDAAKWIIDDGIPNNEQPTGTGTSVYAVVLGRSGLFGILPKGSRDSMIQIEKTLVNGSAQDYTLMTWCVGLALAAETAIARLQNIV